MSVGESRAGSELPAAVGVQGGGRMGAGIAHTFLVGGSAVVLIEQDARSVDAASARVRDSLRKTDQHGGLSASVDEVLQRLVCTTKTELLAEVEIIIEAVPEVLSLKHEVLREIERVAPDAVLATNTSSLSVTELSEGLMRPARLVGMHFFNPVPVSALVEVVAGAHTDPGLVAQVLAWVAALHKTGIVVRDVAGFATSRLGVAIALEAIRMVEEGVASVEDIDTAMTLGYRHQMGPLKTNAA